MPHFQKLTPNLIVSSVERSLTFYVDVLGFARGMTVPESGPLVFASVTSGAIEIFLNAAGAVVDEHPDWSGRLVPSPAGGLFIELNAEEAGAIDALHDRIKDKSRVIMPVRTQWYGMREFAIEDPDGHVITFAQRVEQR